jgi:hypothetical protein
LENLKLSPEQIQILKRHGEDFRNWSNTEKGIKDIQEHIDHGRYFKEKLSPENLNRMTEDEFAEIWKKSWASMMWSKKDWYIKNRLIGPNGVEKIRQGLDQLLYGPEDFVKRYDTFRENVAGFGVAIISELLNMIFPDKYCLWNNKPKTVLTFLRLDALPDNLYKHNIATGYEYLECVNYLNMIKNELSQFGINDFIKLDVFFWHIFEAGIPDQDKKLIQSKEPLDKRSITNLEDLILDFDKDRNFYDAPAEEEAMKMRSEFVSDFPADKILEMNVDEYILGKLDPNTGSARKSTFCYHLDFGLLAELGGNAGTPADKFGIYYDKENQRYIYDDAKFSSPQEAFIAVRSDILKILEIGQQFKLTKNLQELERLDRDFNLRRHVIAKILAAYYPDDFPQIYSEENVRQILDLFGASRKEIPKNFFLKQQKLLALKNADSIMRKWSNLYFSRFVWNLYNRNKETIFKNITIFLSCVLYRSKKTLS